MSETYMELTRNGGTLRGMLHLPEGKPPYPGLVLYHGFGGNRMEPGFLFVRFSRLLAQAGVASIRMDFMGSGESDGSFDEMTLTGEIEDARYILDSFRQRPEINAERIVLLGLSLGGTIAGVVAGLAEQIAGLILWAPAGELADRIEQRLQQSLEKGIDPLDKDGLKLGSDFLPDAKKWKILDGTGRYPGPVLIIHGSGDDVVPSSVSHGYGALFGDRAQLLIIPEADHTFNGLPWREKLFSTSLDFIRQRFEPER